LNNAFEGKLLAFDVDGTLLNYRGELTGRTINALLAAKEAGAVTTLATGRDWRALTNLLNQIPSVEYALCTNGTEVYDRSGKLVYARQISLETAKELVLTIRERVDGVAIGAGINKGIVGEPGVANAMPPGIEILPDQIVGDIVSALKPEIRDLVIYHQDYVHRLDELFSIMVDVCNDFDVAVQYSGLPMMELLPIGSGKGTALAWLAKHLKIKQKDVIAFGDGLNDLSMLEWAGTGIAMGQSETRVQNMADLVIGTCGDEGVAEWLESEING
jgi:hypothetical protein